MDRERGAVGDGGVAAEEDDLGDGLPRGRLPAEVEVVLGDDAAAVLEEADVAVGEGGDGVGEGGAGEPAGHGEEGGGGVDGGGVGGGGDY